LSEKPKRRLVHKHHYMRTMLEKGGLYTFALGFGGGACLFLLLSLLLLWMGAPPWRTNDPDDLDKIWMCVCGGFFGAFCLASVWASATLYKAASQIEPVALITRQNTGYLPAAATLVRGSDRPAADQERELLRAVSQGVETPPEQLLRASQESRP
jgi:hypothetical protein